MATKPARAQRLPVGELEAEARERATLLSQQLPEAVRRRSLPALPPIVIAIGAGETALGIAAHSPLVTAGGAVTLAGGVAFYLLPERRDYEILAPTLEAGVGLLYLGLPFTSPHDRWQIPIGGAHLAMSALGFINFAYSTNPGRTRLRADLSRVRTPAARSSLSLAELRQIERNLYDTDPFVPQWAMGLPLIVGALAATAPIFDRDVASRDKPLIGVIAGGTLVQGFAVSLTPTPAAQYRDALQRAGLTLKWGLYPGGISVLGTFD